MRCISTRGATLRHCAALLCVAVSLLALAACGTSSTSAATNGPRTKLTLGLTYIPDVQFAPFYVAEALGYYRDAGLDVTLRHHTDPTEGEFDALIAGREDAIFAGGDEMMVGPRSKGTQLVYVANVFARYPVALIVPSSSTIHTAADLRGHSIGVPGPYGESYIGLLALLKSGGLTLNDVKVQSIGYTQEAALVSHRVDAVMGYINNDALKLQKAGTAIRTLDVTGGQPLYSNGLVVPQVLLQQHPAETRALVAATLRGVEYALAHPQEAENLSKQFVPGLDDPTTAKNELAVLQATLPLWQPTAGPFGATVPADWNSMDSFLQATGELPASIDGSQAFSNDYLPSK